MDENPQQPGSSGWSFGKIVGLILGLIGMVGFGLCTLCGFVMALDYSDIWLLVLGGAAMTALSVWLVVTMVRKAREARQGKDTSNHP